jgi:SAM-dependent methyltransferase
MVCQSTKIAYDLLRFQPNSPNVLSDCIAEIAALLNTDEARARDLVQRVLDHYHFQIAPMPTDIGSSLFGMIVHVTQPFRLPSMTERMDPLLERLPPSGLSTLLDYGGGGGKDSIIFAKAGYRVTFADFEHVMTDLLRKRFALRNLDVEFHDVLRLPDRRYNIINCLDVIEHIYDVEFVVADLIARLREGGHLLLMPAFFNSWDGDHVEKNCGYVPYFYDMLLQAGLEPVSAPQKAPFLSKIGIRAGFSDELYHVCRTRKISGTIAEERKQISQLLYRLSNKYSTRTMLYCGAVLPFAAGAHGVFRLLGLGRLQRIMPKIADNFFDNYSIRRLSQHRLNNSPHSG